MTDSKINGNEHAEACRGVATRMPSMQVGTYKSWKDKIEKQSKGKEGK